MKSNVVTLAIAALVTLASPYSHASLYEQLPEMPSIEQPSSPGVIDSILRHPWPLPAIDWVGQKQLVAASFGPGEHRYDPRPMGPFGWPRELPLEHRYDPRPMDPDGWPEDLPRGWPWPRHWNWVA